MNSMPTLYNQQLHYVHESKWSGTIGKGDKTRKGEGEREERKKRERKKQERKEVTAWLRETERLFSRDEENTGEF